MDNTQKTRRKYKNTFMECKKPNQKKQKKNPKMVYMLF